MDDDEIVYCTRCGRVEDYQLDTDWSMEEWVVPKLYEKEGKIEKNVDEYLCRRCHVEYVMLTFQFFYKDWKVRFKRYCASMIKPRKI